VKSSFWKNKKVLITGHTGFTGGWLTAVLELFDAKICAISLKPKYPKTLYELLNLKKKIMKSYIADLRNEKKIKNIITRFNPEIVFHLAAQPLVIDGYKNPIETFQSNITGTINVLESCRKCSNIKSIIIVTTDKCYQNDNGLKNFSEKDKLGGDDPYSASKASAEIVAHSYYKSFFEKKNISISTARAGNIIGGGDWSKNRLMTDLVKSLFNNKNFIIRNPNATRPWQHVLDVVSGYLLLAKKSYEKPKKIFGAWNFGPNFKDTTSVKTIIYMMEKISKKKIKIKTKNSEFKEKKYLSLNTQKSREKLKWKKKISLVNMLKFTFDWYKCYQNKKDLKKITYNQINNYFRSII